jgi:RNA polymerase sigma factor (sigma-70 family)
VTDSRYQHISEQELLNRYYADHNKEWLGILFQRYTLLLLGVCLKYLKNEDAARDAVQQIFLKAITELDKYKVDYFKSWLYMIAKNHCLMQFRIKNRNAIELSDELHLPDEPNIINDIKEKEQLLNWMHEGLQLLHAEQQQCVTLFYLDKNSYQQIATTTGFTMLQVKSFIQNGKRNLKMMIEKKLLLKEQKS